MNIRIVEAKVMYMSFEISQMPNIYYYGVLYSSINLISIKKESCWYISQNSYNNPNKVHYAQLRSTFHFGNN